MELDRLCKINSTPKLCYSNAMKNSMVAKKFRIKMDMAVGFFYVEAIIHGVKGGAILPHAVNIIDGIYLYDTTPQLLKSHMFQAEYLMTIKQEDILTAFKNRIEIEDFLRSQVKKIKATTQ